MALVLVVDDDVLFGCGLSRIIESSGHKSLSAQTLDAGIKAAQSYGPDLVFLDVLLPDGNGIEALSSMRQVPSAPDVVVITGFGDPDSAEAAIINGAWSYIEKTSPLQQIIITMERALSYREQRERCTQALKKEGIVGNCPGMQRVYEQVALAAASRAGVLITGETGTGKELIAKAIHANSPRRDKPFIIVDCAALPATLAESVLFGHVKGAFTGACMHQPGLLAAAHGGTLFLDEIGELPMSVQPVFLRALQERRFRPVGSNTETASDFRLVAATNRDLDQLARQDKFRSDLLFRIRAQKIHLPPLRERNSDLNDLVQYHMNRLCLESGRPPKQVSPELLETIAAYEWPGNVRELVQTLKLALSTSIDETMLFPEHLSLEVRAGAAKKLVAKRLEPVAYRPPSMPMPLPKYRDFRNESLRLAEAHYLSVLLDAAGGKASLACKLSGLSKTRYYAMLKKHGISSS